LFGIIDPSVTPNKLTCDICKESTAKKGSNNGESLLMHDFFENNWLMKNGARQSLAVAMDNCGGQNKNNNIQRRAAHRTSSKWDNFALATLVSISGTTPRMRVTGPSIR
jgi:hypothetical protein